MTGENEGHNKVLLVIWSCQTEEQLRSAIDWADKIGSLFSPAQNQAIWEEIEKQRKKIRGDHETGTSRID